MSEKSYWRGYIDSQDKRDWATGTPTVCCARRRPLEPLAELTGLPVEEYRSGYRVLLYKLDTVLPPVSEPDDDYIRGWFGGMGIRHKDRLTITGENVKRFRSMVEDRLEMDLPKTQQPSKTSKSLRLIITGDKMKKVDNFLRKRL